MQSLCFDQKEMPRSRRTLGSECRSVQIYGSSAAELDASTDEQLQEVVESGVREETIFFFGRLGPIGYWDAVTPE